ncbi:DUF4129 domain-containing protein [Actinopolymorpha sp. B17G11]|uniref:DUF4129 domain-containing protein n=1 Tax=Actinopolymorpha sp. B17G11 TaxID=3160861 RepID=UPI0032E3E81E
MEVDRTLRRAGPVVVVLGLLALITTIALVSGPSATRLPTPERTAGTPAAPPPPPPAPEISSSASPTGAPAAADVPAWVGTILLVVLALVTVALLAGVVYLFRRYVRIKISPRRPRPVLETVSEPVPAAEELHAAVAAGIEELADDSADPRRAVIGCWLRLEAAAAAAGTEREPHDTPADLVGRVLTAHEVSPEPLRVLAELYRQARYAPDVVDETMRDTARATLTRLRTELGRPAVTS